MLCIFARDEVIVRFLTSFVQVHGEGKFGGAALPIAHEAAGKSPKTVQPTGRQDSPWRQHGKVHRYRPLGLRFEQFFFTRCMQFFFASIHWSRSTVTIRLSIVIIWFTIDVCLILFVGPGISYADCLKKNAQTATAQWTNQLSPMFERKKKLQHNWRFVSIVLKVFLFFAKHWYQSKCLLCSRRFSQNNLYVMSSKCLIPPLLIKK